MEKLKEILGLLTGRLQQLAGGNAVVGKKISVGGRHVIPLCELSLGFAAGGGVGQGTAPGQAVESKGEGGGAGGGARAVPLAVIVVDGGKVRVEQLGR